MKTLIIPDIHHKRTSVDLILKEHYDSVDKVIFLGDFFDAYNDSPVDAKKTAEWLKKKIQDPKLNFIWGNHDIPYAYPWNQHLYCSGFTIEKSKAISKVMSVEDWSRFVPYVWDQGFLLSHAGANWNFIRRLSSTFKHSTIQLDEIENELAISYKIDKGENLPNGTKTILFNAGWDRGGREPAGGLNWGCWSVFNPVPGLKQIVGHTIQNIPSIKYIKEGMICSASYDAISYKEINEEFNLDIIKGWAINLDTNSNHYAISEGGDLNIIKNDNQRL